jgi:hypothetical protein
MTRNSKILVFKNLIKNNKMPNTNTFIFHKKQIPSHKNKIPNLRNHFDSYQTESSRRNVIKSLDIEDYPSFQNSGIHCISGRSLQLNSHILKTEELFNKDILTIVIIIINQFFHTLIKISQKFYYQGLFKFFSNIKTYGLTMILKKWRTINYLNKLFSLRNIITTLSYHKNIFYKCFFYKWKELLKKEAEKKMNKVINFIDNVTYL